MPPGGSFFQLILLRRFCPIIPVENGHDIRKGVIIVDDSRSTWGSSPGRNGGWRTRRKRCSDSPRHPGPDLPPRPWGLLSPLPGPLKARGDHCDRHFIFHVLVEGGAPNDVGVLVGTLGDDLRSGVDLVQRRCRGEEVMLMITPFAPAILVSSRGLEMAAIAACSALSLPLAWPTPIWA